MTPVVLISGGLTFVVAVLVLRPFSTAGGGHLYLRARTSDEVRRHELLRQLRDLDDDLAAGKLTEADHVGLRAPVEREAAAVLRRIKAHGRATGTGGVTSGAGSGSVTSRQPRDHGAGAAARRWRRRTVMLLALAGGMASVTVLLVGAVSHRSAGQTISGGSAGAVMSAGGTSDEASASNSGRQSPTPEQLAAIDAAVARVKQNPRNVTAHLALADAYAAGGASQLAAVEYLVVTRLDPANAEASTGLALLAFEVGRTAQAKTMVDRVLAADPDQPEALYVRGLILLMGLRQPQAAERDLNAYLAVAPFGSHRTAAVTLLALASSQDHR
jgi:cytochrome c-type biogenesis protein CcmH/NrfG